MKLPMSFLLCLAHCQQNPKNTLYPTEVMVSSPEMLQKAVHYDYVGARFKGGYRSIQNFLMSNVSIMDCDNTHTKDPLQMVHPEQLALIHPEVAYAVVPSRHNWMAKGNFPAAPRYHTFYFHDPFFRAEQEGALKGIFMRDSLFMMGIARTRAVFSSAMMCGWRISFGIPGV